MDLYRYQRAAARTISNHGQYMTAHALHGLAAEVGELNSIYQKALQGHPFDLYHAKRELGDILWMICEYATSMGWNMNEIAHINIDKLLERYPNGFDTQRSIHRAKGDL